MNYRKDARTAQRSYEGRFYSTRLNLTAAAGVYLEVNAQFDESTGLLTWTFTSLDPVTLDLPVGNPEEGFLPPDVVSPEGDAWISYTVAPKADDTTGTVINAQATVYFNDGLPDQSSLATAPIFNTIDAGAPTSSVASLPASSLTSFTVSWSGQDDPGGSGVASYDVYVSDDGGPFTAFRTDTTATSATFTGQVGNTYGFYSVATDNVGNVQPTPSAAQATTEVVSPLTITSVETISPNSRNTPVSEVAVSLSELGSPGGFNDQALTLTDDGGPNLITGAVTVTPITATSYTISGLAGLTSAEGKYTLTVNAADITDPYGYPGTGTLSTSWLMDTTPPKSTVSPLPQTTTSTTITVSVTGSDPNGSNGSPPSGIASFALYGSTDSGPFAFLATLTPASPSTLFTGQVGHKYGFYSVATDYAGNVQSTPTSAQATTRVVSLLGLTSIAPVSPNPRNTAISSIDVTFSAPINTGSLSPGALTLTDDGGPNLIDGGVSLSLVGGTTATYAIGGLESLTTPQGEYTLTVNVSDIQDLDGISGSGTISTSWLMDTTPPTSTVNPLLARETSLSFPVTVTGSDPTAADGGPASGVANDTIFVSINGGAWAQWTVVSAANPTATYTGQSNTTYSFYSIAADNAGNVEGKAPAIEASTYLPDLTPPVSIIDPTTGTNPSTVNSTTGTFTLDLTGSDPGGAVLSYFEVFVSIDGGTYQEVGPYAIPAGFADGSGHYHSTIAYQGLTDGQSHNYSFYSIGLDSAGNLQSAPGSPNVTFADQVFTLAQPGQLQVSSFTVEHGSPSRSFIQYLDLGFNESDAQSGSDLTTIVNSIGTASLDITIYKYDLNGDASSKTAVPLSSPTMLSVIDHAIEIDFGAGGIGGSPTTTAADGYYEVDIKLPDRQIAVHHFYRLLGDVAGDGIVDQNDLNEIAESIGETSQMGWAPLSAAVTGDGTVTALDLLLATRSKNQKLGSGLALG